MVLHRTKKLANEFKRQLEYLGEKTENYIASLVPIKNDTIFYKK